jgi:hypothetical protein
MSYTETRSLPIAYRNWFVDRLAKEFKDRAQAQKKVSERRPGSPRDIPMGEMARSAIPGPKRFK